MWTSLEGVSVTTSWVFLPPPSPSLPPRRRKGRGRSNRSDVPAGGENNQEGENDSGEKRRAARFKIHTRKKKT